MKEQFNQIWTNECRMAPGTRVLVALSGGADSTILLRLLCEAGIDCMAAHCNFHLRGEESNRDEWFVENLCALLHVPLRVAHFDTQNYAREMHVSIEMAARELRYNWFDKLLADESIEWLALGHHADDQVETFFLNALRGTGIHGLAGMSCRKGNRVRPLLAFSRSELEAYAALRGWDYVNDSSNLSDEPLRNRIRHQVMPVFKQMNPAFLQVMRGNMERVAQIEKWLAHQVDSFRAEAVAEVEGQVLISVEKLRALLDPELFLFEILSPFGFNGDQISQIGRCVAEGVSGRQFFSASHRLVVDRYNLLVLSLLDQPDEPSRFYVESGVGAIQHPIPMAFQTVDRTAGFQFSKELNCIHLDASLLEFPLVIRRWQRGDLFRPLGMKGFKKLSDFFTDSKLSLIDKEQVWLLCSGDEVVWVVGYRMDDRFKVSDQTRQILEVKLL